MTSEWPVSNEMGEIAPFLVVLALTARGTPSLTITLFKFLLSANLSSGYNLLLFCLFCFALFERVHVCMCSGEGERVKGQRDKERESLSRFHAQHRD